MLGMKIHGVGKSLEKNIWDGIETNDSYWKRSGSADEKEVLSIG